MDFLPSISGSAQSKVIFYKGPSYNIDEKVFLKKIENDWKEIFVDEVKVPMAEKRYVVGFESVPRGTNSKKLVKLSSFI
jgi:hypothetical protein